MSTLDLKLMTKTDNRVPSKQDCTGLLIDTFVSMTHINLRRQVEKQVDVFH